MSLTYYFFLFYRFYKCAKNLQPPFVQLFFSEGKGTSRRICGSCGGHWLSFLPLFSEGSDIKFTDFHVVTWLVGEGHMLCTVGAAQAHTPSTKNYAVEIPTWSILRDLQHHMTTSVKCNGLLLPWTTALLIAVEPQPGKYALNSSPLQIYTIHKPAHLTYFVKQPDVQGISQTFCSSFVSNYVETIH